MSPSLFLELVLLVTVTLAGAADLATRKIPNRLVVGGLCAALGLRLLGPHWPLAWLAGALTGLLLFLPLYLLRGMAAGDVKLMAMVGSFTGPSVALQIALLACAVGGLMGLAMVLYHGRLRCALGNLRALASAWLRRAIGTLTERPALPAGASAGDMPYGLAIAVGTLLVLVWRHC